MNNDYRIYMDCCCINRPYDDTNNPIVLLEGQAVIAIAFKCFYDNWKLIGSEAIEYEISKTPDEKKKIDMLNFYSIIKENITINNIIKTRMNILIKQKIKALDALHLACAEYTKADVFLTTDINFMKKAKKVSTIKIENPINWLMEAERDEN
jgi:predicted nucleic acid-binding protein